MTSRNLDAADSPLRAALAVGLGAGLGALGRTALVSLAQPGSPQEIIAVLAVNVLGCLLMGWLKPGPFLGAGVLGGFTTFSAVAVAAAQTSAIWALILLVTSFVLCVGAWVAGDVFRRRRV
mgnify:FL=1